MVAVVADLVVVVVTMIAFLYVREDEIYDE